MYSMTGERNMHALYLFNIYVRARTCILDKYICVSTKAMVESDLKKNMTCLMVLSTKVEFSSDLEMRNEFKLFPANI